MGWFDVVLFALIALMAWLHRLQIDAGKLMAEIIEGLDRRIEAIESGKEE